MSGINKVILVGHLGKDPEIRHMEGGVSKASFPLATSEFYTKDGQRVEQTEWHNIVVWRGLADIAEKYLHKGKLVYVEGKLRTRSWDDKEGNKRYMTEVVADNFTMLGRRSDHENQGGNESYGGGNTNRGGSGNSRDAAGGSEGLNVRADDNPEDDLPF
ncbi:single-strand binding protein [Anseongella ginsenosidimutans]|uniref:Single-stranded DNA-binding protein n=1 Tax=Anseongella ginsenosidimutans TaxID=496056 RepID=A0A4R3KVF1_9SPHI|nr:single-stranded DNA-binding protein [Anseongella ginsenosidimutans]QEC51770.1 single-stranded DNA-binding protein [Anseongella ginsenosidimutans]TCS89138.1 single-strand binding protein [Anseongella ginsenosidimutans]